MVAAEQAAAILAVRPGVWMAAEEGAMNREVDVGAAGEGNHAGGIILGQRGVDHGSTRR